MDEIAWSHLLLRLIANMFKQSRQMSPLNSESMGDNYEKKTFREGRFKICLFLKSTSNSDNFVIHSFYVYSNSYIVLWANFEYSPFYLERKIIILLHTFHAVAVSMVFFFCLVLCFIM